MKGNLSAFMGVASLVILLIIVIIIQRGVTPEKLQKALDKIEDVSVVVESPAEFNNYTLRKITYGVKTKECFIRWEFVTSRYNDTLKTWARLRYPYEAKCSLSFEQQLPIHQRILKRAFVDWDKSKLNEIMMSSFLRVDTTGVINRRIISEALKSEEVMDFKKNYPKHKSRLSSNAILVNLINDHNLFPELVNLFLGFDLKIKLNSCEKVFNANHERAQAVGTVLPKNIKSIFYDAATFDFKVLVLGK